MTTLYDTVVISSSSSEGLQLPINQGSYYSIPVQQVINDVDAFRIKQVIVPRTFNTISASGGLQLTFGLQGNISGSQSIAIPAGNYSSTALANYIASAWFTATGTNIIVSFTNAQFKTSITVAGGTDTSVAITATELALPGMGPILGFYQTIATSGTITSSNVFHLTGPNVININCSELAAGMGGRNLISNSLTHNGRDGQYVRSDVIYQLGSLGNGGDSSLNIFPSEWFQFSKLQNLSRLTLVLVDENSQQINLNGFSWQISIELRQKKNI